MMIKFHQLYSSYFLHSTSEDSEHEAEVLTFYRVGSRDQLLKRSVINI